jgi:gallate dioxygenase
VSYPEDLKVAIVATGGLSHQVHGELAGFNNTPWDMEFLELLEKDPEKLTGITIAQYAERGGFEGAEVIMWLIMRGALSASVKKLHQAYYLPSMTPIATVIYEDASSSRRRIGCAVPRAHRPRVGRYREASGDLPLYARSQREGVPAQRLPSPARRAGFQAGLPGRS